MQQFRTSGQIVTENGNVTADCNAITFYNKGGATATVIGVPLATGESLEIPGSANEIDRSNYDVAFSGTGSQQLIVLRKTYF